MLGMEISCSVEGGGREAVMDDILVALRAPARGGRRSPRRMRLGTSMPLLRMLETRRERQ